MSRYLIERIGAAPNIELHDADRSGGAVGTPQGQLDRVGWRLRHRQETAKPIRNVFLFVGADPATGWLKVAAWRGRQGRFVRTGLGRTRRRPVGRGAETSVPGVFAVGDVRSGSVKRVGGAIGEGAQVVATLHGFLATPATPAKNTN